MMRFLRGHDYRGRGRGFNAVADRSVIRLAIPSDVTEITALIDAAYSGYAPLLQRNPQPMDDDYSVLIAAGEVTVRCEEGQILGVLVCQQREDHLLVRTVGIRPDRQRLGLGSELMRYAETIAAEHGWRVLRLYTNEVMTGNVELYQRLGYSETHRTGPDGRQVIYMLKELGND